MAEFTSKNRIGRNDKVDGVYYRFADEIKPTSRDGAEHGDTLFIIDSGEAFIYYKGEWREL